jgi:hypothetical protein
MGIRLFKHRLSWSASIGEDLVEPEGTAADSSIAKLVYTSRLTAGIWRGLQDGAHDYARRCFPPA